MAELTIGLLGQPNSGKSTLFNQLTGSRQHVGNWPGKTVEQKEGRFSLDGKDYTIVDLPGSYGLSANSEEELITREYITSGNAGVVYLIADASQLERSLFMLADYAGMRTPVVLLLNMMDIAVRQGKSIDCGRLSKTLGIPVVPITASDRKCYTELYSILKGEHIAQGLEEASIQKLYVNEIGEPFTRLLELLPESGIGAYSPTWLAAKLLEGDKPVHELVRGTVDADTMGEAEAVVASVKDGSLVTGGCKFQWIDALLKDTVQRKSDGKPKLSRFDRIATSKVWGKPLAVLVILFGLIFSMMIAMPLMLLFAQIPAVLTQLIAGGLSAAGAPVWLVSLIGDAVLGAISFTLLMVSFVVGVSLVFGFVEEVGYMARISYAFDNTMAKLGLQGKAVMPFLVSLGCNIGVYREPASLIPGPSGCLLSQCRGSCPAHPPGRL